MSVQLSYASTIKAVETLTANVPDVTSGNAVITHDQFSSTKTLNGATTPPVSQVASFQQALSSGAATIDLTNLPGTNNLAINGNGQKVQVAKFIADPANANPITLKFGASNPYNLLGASWQITLAPGEEALFYLNGAAPTIGSGAKNIDLSGTGSQVVKCIFVMG